jgi:hypothetical protein
MQWDRVLRNISSVPLLLRQKKEVGLSTEILINIIKSLVLSQFRFSGILHDLSSERAKGEMQHFQNKLLRIISVKRDESRIKYGIEDISLFIERTGLEQTIQTRVRPCVLVLRTQANALVFLCLLLFIQH